MIQTEASGYVIEVAEAISLFQAGRPLIIGGVEVPFSKGLDGHSDGDVLIHSIIDALLGAAGMGDIGMHFPSSDVQYKDINSIDLLVKTYELISEKWRVCNVDATIIAERPSLKNYLKPMKQIIAYSIEIDSSQVNIKATTTDGLGFTGRGDGISSLSIVMLESMK